MSGMNKATPVPLSGMSSSSMPMDNMIGKGSMNGSNSVGSMMDDMDMMGMPDMEARLYRPS